METNAYMAAVIWMDTQVDPHITGETYAWIGQRNQHTAQSIFRYMSKREERIQDWVDYFLGKDR